MFYVTYNVETGALLNISDAAPAVAGHPLQVRSFEGPVPDLMRVEWVPNLANFVERPKKLLSKLEYLRRFTQGERIAIREAAKTIPQLEDYLMLLELAQDVCLSDPDTQGAVHMLEGVGLLGAGRAAEILG